MDKNRKSKFDLRNSYKDKNIELPSYFYLNSEDIRPEILAATKAVNIKKS